MKIRKIEVDYKISIRYEEMYEIISSQEEIPAKFWYNYFLKSTQAMIKLLSIS